MREDPDDNDSTGNDLPERFVDSFEDDEFGDDEDFFEDDFFGEDADDFTDEDLLTYTGDEL